MLTNRKGFFSLNKFKGCVPCMRQPGPGRRSHYSINGIPQKLSAFFQVAFCRLSARSGFNFSHNSCLLREGSLATKHRLCFPEKLLMFFVQFYEPCAAKVRVKNVENYSLLLFCSLDKHLLPQIYRQLVHLKLARFTPEGIFIKIQSIFHHQPDGALTHILPYFRAIPTVKLDSPENFYESLSLRKPKMTTQRSNQGQG